MIVKILKKLNTLPFVFSLSHIIGLISGVVCESVTRNYFYWRSLLWHLNSLHIVQLIKDVWVGIFFLPCTFRGKKKRDEFVWLKWWKPHLKQIKEYFAELIYFSTAELSLTFYFSRKNGFECNLNCQVTFIKWWFCPVTGKCLPQNWLAADLLHPFQTLQGRFQSAVK